MNIPEIDSLWIDNDPRTTLVRYVLVTGAPVDDRVPCISWYDLPMGATAPRVIKNKVERFQPSSTGHWKHNGFRPAEAEPKLGYPSGYGPDAKPFTGSGS